MTPYLAAVVLWVAFLATWYAAMVWTARAVARNSLASRAADTLIYAVAFGLLFVPHRAGGAVGHGLWREAAPVGYALVGLEAAAFAFAWWARLHIGRLWSGTITLREGHRVVDTGPYRLVRHPIYTGFLGAAWAFALIVAAPTALLGAALLTLQMTWKARREEAFLRQELGPAAYEAYAARTPMLIPFLPVAARR